MTDNELLLALSSMIDEKLKPFEHKLKEIKTDIHEIQLTLENDTNKLLRVAALESEIKKIKKKIEQIA